MPPPAEEAPRAGPEALGDLDAPPWGAIDTLPYDQGEGVGSPKNGTNFTGGYIPSPWSRSRSLALGSACRFTAA